MITKGSEILLSADFIQHFLVAVTVRIRIFCKNLRRSVSFPVSDDPTGNQIQLGFGAGEVEVLTSVQKRRTCRPHMHFFRTALIEKLGRLTELCSTYNRIVDQKEIAILDQRLYRN